MCGNFAFLFEMKMTMRINKIVLLLLTAVLFIQCDTVNSVFGGSSKSSSRSKTSTSRTKTSTSGSRAHYNIQYRDDFLSVSDREKESILKESKATEDQYSLLVFTKNFKGEKIVVTSQEKRLFSGYLISNIKTGYADKLTIDNTEDIRVYDNLTKKEIVIDSKEAKKHKFIYLQKDNSNKESPFILIYSNTLRPLD